MTRSVVDPAVWALHPALDELPPARLPGAGDRVLVVVPHPDDETLGLGGTLALLARTGAAVELVLVTDGEGADPDAPAAERAALASLRREELRLALGTLGLPGAAVHRLGLPDRHVDRYEHAVVDGLSRLLDGSPALVLAPHEQDGHRDHEAAARAAVVSARTAGCRLASYAVWLWHRREPGEVDLAPARRVALDPAARAAKARALAEYRSQTGGPQPVVPAALRHLAAAADETLWEVA